MKRSIIIVILMTVIAFSQDLPAYVAQFDQELAIELYEQKLDGDQDPASTYRALANLYHQTGRIGLAEDCYRHLIEIRNGSEDVYKSYLDFLYQNGSYEKLRGIIREKEFHQDWSGYLEARSYFQEGRFDSSLMISQELPADLAGKLGRLSIEGMELKHRSPALGGIMSAVIPGSGKVYAGRLLDGMQAFSVVIAPAYNAYYHFNKTGVKSVRAWVWTAVASWFYLSDIYGSVKAVHEYNELQKLKVIERFEE